MVLLKIFPRRYGVDNNIEVQSINVEDDKCYIDHVYNGIDTLRFEIPNTDENYRNYIEEESKVIPVGLDTNRKFVVKKIDDHSNFAVVDCEIDLDDWKSNVFMDFRTTNSTIGQVLNQIIPTGWSIYYENNVDTTKRTTVEYQEGEPFRCATAYTIIGYVSEAYNVVFNYNNDIKRLSVIDPGAYENSGEYFAEDLNMKEIGFNGDSSNYVSRIYAYGKKDDNGNYLTIESVNDGKQYVEDLSYAGKIISSSIVDERYDVPENLKSYAEKVLNNNCLPVRSYKCSVINFNDNMWLYKVVTIIDRVKKLRIEHQCVAYREYKNNSLDEVTLSTSEPNVVRKYEEANLNTDVKLERMQTRVQKDIENLSSAVSNSSGLYETLVVEPDGSAKYYYHNKPLLEDSLIQILISDIGVTVTPDGGTTWYGLQVDGALIANILSVNGINAGWITTGALVIEDSQGNETFYANVETGEVRISGDIRLATSTLEVKVARIQVQYLYAASETDVSENIRTYTGDGLLIRSLEDLNVYKFFAVTSEGIRVFNSQKSLTIPDSSKRFLNQSIIRTLYTTSSRKYLHTIRDELYQMINSQRSDYSGIGYRRYDTYEEKNSQDVVDDSKTVNSYEVLQAVPEQCYVKGHFEREDGSYTGDHDGYFGIAKFEHNGSASRSSDSFSHKFRADDRINWEYNHQYDSGRTISKKFLADSSLEWKYSQDSSSTSISSEVNIKKDEWSILTQDTSSVNQMLKFLFNLTNFILESDNGYTGYYYKRTFNIKADDTSFSVRREYPRSIPSSSGNYYYEFELTRTGATINGNSVNTSSSKRYKQHIELLHDEEFNPHKLLKLKVKQFMYKEGHVLQFDDMEGRLLPGFIAEDVAEIYPSAVIHNKDGEIESWDERRIIPGMLSLIQEQNDIIQKQKEKINDLEERLCKLEEYIANLYDDWR